MVHELVPVGRHQGHRQPVLGKFVVEKNALPILA